MIGPEAQNKLFAVYQQVGACMRAAQRKDAQSIERALQGLDRKLSELIFATLEEISKPATGSTSPFEADSGRS